MSATNLSGSRTMNASPRGNQHTNDGSSFFSISINLRGNGLECPVVRVDDCLVDRVEGDRLVAVVVDDCAFISVPNGLGTGEKVLVVVLLLIEDDRDRVLMPVVRCCIPA